MSIFRCHKRKQFIWGYVSVFVVLMGIAVFANSALAMEHGGMGGRPAYPQSDNPRTESIFIHTLEPGVVQEEGILLVNNTAEQKTLSVYGVDSMVSSGGAFACRQMTEPKEGVGSWIELAKSEVTLDSGTNEIVPFTIAVPQNAGVGEHNGCIVIQEKKEKIEGQTGMTLSFRTGLRVAITIPGELTRKLEIVGFTVTPQKKDGGFLLQPKVKNLGNVSIDADIQVVTRYFFGLTLVQHGGQFPILRGEVSDWNFELKKPFWGGWYQSSFAVEYGEDSATEIGNETEGQKVRLEGPSVWFFSSPKPAALAIEIIVLLLIGFSGFLFWLSRKRKRWIKTSWVEYEIKSGEDIKSLAEQFDVSWKMLAKVNKLKPPYALKPGEKISAPGGSASGGKVPPTK
ncbi:MAG: LysM peptidoglycan-binding domain-containing protein [Candidatus Woesebacteria bacterium]|nr:LysM peptidoglycan-binding domain-containing protein [Candidatus Woesebacteria bacterium]